MLINEVFLYLRVRNAANAIDFDKAAFGAVEGFRLSEPSGCIGHAELNLSELSTSLGWTLKASQKVTGGRSGAKPTGDRSLSILCTLESCQSRRS